MAKAKARKGRKKSVSRKKKGKVGKVGKVEKRSNKDSLSVVPSISKDRQAALVLLTRANARNDDLHKRYKIRAANRAFDFCRNGRSACQTCQRSVGRRGAAGELYCQFTCPEKTVFCSEVCKEKGCHNCVLYKYRTEGGTGELQSTVQLPMRDHVVAEMPIILEIPRVAYYWHQKSVKSVFEVPCIQCGVVNQENWVEEAVDQYAIIDEIKATNCKKCKWPVCPGPDCKKQHGKECRDLTNFARSFESQGLRHPMLMNRDRAFWMLGLMRLSILQKRNKDLFNCFELLMNERTSYSFDITRDDDDEKYFNMFLKEFENHFSTFRLWSTIDVKRIVDTLLYYAVHAASISWMDAHAGKCVLLGVKFHYGCIPNIILTKELGANRVLLKTLRPVKEDEILSLGIYQYGSSALIANPIFDSDTVGFGDHLNVQRSSNKKECTSSACTICLGEETGNMLQLGKLRKLWGYPALCEKKLKKTTLHPVLTIRPDRTRKVEWKCRACGVCKGSKGVDYRRLHFQSVRRTILGQFSNTPFDKLGDVVTSYYKTTDWFFRLDKMMIFANVINQVHYYVNGRLERAPPNGPHPLLTVAEYNSMKKIYNLYFIVLGNLKSTDFFRYETEQIKWLEATCYMWTEVVGASIEEYGDKHEIFHEATKNMEILTGLPQVQSVTKGHLTIIEARLTSVVDRLHPE
ncbi:uncharacterized protein LOC110853388 isoform X2 [Folsomia candida]|uniref:uncharacterized protein LOC110853388 isoform X2 n=1 Tax=Folsomia candida TaxID=158441 RepID=UPI000B902AD7|nr:uncharacterized protein LOC110853388 isoform X2 [Folsomia candida]